MAAEPTMQAVRTPAVGSVPAWDPKDADQQQLPSIPVAWWRFLAEASLALEESLDYETTLARVARLSVPSIADFCAIALGTESGPITWVEAVHRDPAKATLAERLHAYPLGANPEEDPVLRAFACPVPQLVPMIDEERLRRFANDAAHRELLRELAPTSLMVMPLTARGRTFGSLILVATADSGRHYGDTDVVIAREVARRAALAVDHATLFAEAVRAARARERVLAVVSHDLKNPLNVITMSADMLEELAPDDAAHQQERARIRAIARAADQMRRLVDDLLDASALEAGRLHMAFAPTAADAALREAIYVLGPLAAASGVVLAVEAGADLPAVRADRHRLAQVFGNLIGNAIKFTPRGGRVLVTATREDETLEYCVIDSGCGIEPAELAHVFDRFWQAPGTARSGHGLGLAIARAIVEAHGGRMHVRSLPGQGATFSFRIPLAAGADVRDRRLSLA